MNQFFQQVALFGGLAVAAIGIGGSLLPQYSQPTTAPARDPRAPSDWRDSRDRLDQLLSDRWQLSQLAPAPPADSRTVARRLALALVGTIPSLEEWRLWETWPPQDRVTLWTEHLLADRRSSDFLAERFARAFVGNDNGPFLVFRRRRFVSWLSDQIHDQRPYDELVRELLAGQGLWTTEPAVNFVTSTIGTGEEEGQPNPVRLATRTSRAFLATRLDCVQCHDDQFGGPWQQSDFHQFAAFFSGTRSTITGIRDQHRSYRVRYVHAETEVEVPYQVPFAKELLDASSIILPDVMPPHVQPHQRPPRQQLAEWVTHPENRAFSRAIVNRMWGILFGKPLVEPVDDIPVKGDWPAVLVQLEGDFREHGYNLQRLVHIIANSRAFGLASHATYNLTAEHEANWACFPIVRLRPEQVAGAVQQAASLQTLDSQSHILVRLATHDQRTPFIRRFGDGGEQELVPLRETMAQNLLLMNGEMVAEKTKIDLMGNAATHIAFLARTDATALQALFLAVLSREPTREEVAVYGERLANSHGDERSSVLCDLAWVLLNSSEFGWSH
ncbi:MAG: DUF1553 domain-containing protein [Planctomycetota bacterium]|nr:DUF1553 domain-containing protein [Planctomycetota bacterium]MDA1179198.1 DUF1553 domain-containing protein [Planctomycetota bacterium]